MDTRHIPRLLVVGLFFLLALAAWPSANYSSTASGAPRATKTPTPTKTPAPTPTPTSTPAPSNTTYYVSTTGIDTNSGTLGQPFGTVNKGLSVLKAGNTLMIRGGEYVENISRSGLKGTASDPITVKNYPNERPVIRGLLGFSCAEYLHLDGVNVTWKDGNASDRHMVKMSGGHDWTITNSEFWGAKSFAGLLISGSSTCGGAVNFRVAYNSIHDTYPSNSSAQDHLIYVNNALGGLIERNLLYNSANGRAIKMGPTDTNVTYPRNVTIQYNTMYNNLGPSNLQFSYGANNNTARYNIFLKSAAPDASKEWSGHNATHYNLTGENNVVNDNVGWDSVGVVQGGNTGLIDGGENLYIDPQVVSTSEPYNFHPQNPAAYDYGRYAGEPDQAPPLP